MPFVYSMYTRSMAPRDTGENAQCTLRDDKEMAQYYKKTWKAMEELVELGVAKSIGVANFSKSQLQHILNNCRIKPAVNRVECHAYSMQPKLFDFCLKHNIAITGYTTPVASPGRWDKNTEELVLSQDPLVVAIAGRVDKSPTQVLIRYLVERGWIAIPRSANKAQIQENFAVFDFQLTESDLTDLDGLDRNLRFFKFFEIEDEPDPFEDKDPLSRQEHHTAMCVFYTPLVVAFVIMLCMMPPVTTA